MRSRTTRGWHALAWLGGTFVGLQLLASVALDYVVPSVRNPMLHKHLDDLTSAAIPEVVCLGSSRLGCAIDDRLASQVLRQATGEPRVRVFNAALPGADPVTWEPIVQELLAQPTPPRLFVLELVPESVSERSISVTFHIERQLTWSNLHEYVRGAALTPNLGRLILSRILPLLAFREPLRASALRPLRERAYHSGQERYGDIPWDEVVGGTREPSSDARIRASLYLVDKELRDYSPRGPARAALERSLARCRAAGVPVLLLGVPLPQAHRDKYTPTVAAAFADYVASLGGEYVACGDRLPDACFADHNHASGDGRTRFTRDFVTAVLAPRWWTLTR